MTGDRKPSAINNAAATKASPKKLNRRKFLAKTGGVLAAGAFGAVPLRGWAADPINIGAL